MSPLVLGAGLIAALIGCQAAPAAHRQSAIGESAREGPASPVPRLEQPPAEARRPPARRVAVQLAWLPPTPSARAALWRDFAQQGIDTIIIKGFRNRRDPPYGAEPAGEARAGVYFRTAHAPRLQDLVDEAVPEAHRAGLAVFVWMPVRAMDWAVQRHPDWQDWSFDPVSGALRPSGRLDPWRPEVQEYLVRLLTDLAASGIDGLLFGEDLFVGEYGGLGPAARARFAAEFQTRPTPELFWSPAGGAPARLPQRLPMFWRWAGWKSRATGEQMAALIRQLRAARPALLVAQNVAPEAILRPADALAQWNVELLALSPSVDYVAVLTYPDPAQSLTASIGELTGLVDRAVQLMGAADRIMIKVPLMDRRTGRRLPEAQVGRFLAAVGRDHAPGLAYLYNSDAIRQVPHRSLARPSRLD